MRIAFMWKWWSWKTTVTISFLKYITKERADKQKLIFDVDINSHLFKEYSLNKNDIDFFSWDFLKIADIFEPEFKKTYDLDFIPSFWTLPINKNTNLIKWDLFNHDFVKKYWYDLDSTTKLFTLWNYITKKTQIWECYHSLLNSYELLLHRIIDDKNSYVIADTTAWIDNLWTSLCLWYDITIFVVEPSERSLSVYKDYINTAWIDPESVFVLWNKIEDEDDLDYINKNVKTDKLLWFLKFNKKINRDEWADRYELFIEDNLSIFNTILEKLDSADKNWNSYYNRVHKLFIDESKSWFSSFYNKDLEKILTLDKNLINKIQKWE